MNDTASLCRAEVRNGGCGLHHTARRHKRPDSSGQSAADLRAAAATTFSNLAQRSIHERRGAMKNTVVTRSLYAAKICEKTAITFDGDGRYQQFTSRKITPRPLLPKDLRSDGCSELENAVCAQQSRWCVPQAYGCSELENAVCAQRLRIDLFIAVGCSELENAVCAQPKTVGALRVRCCSELENAVCAQHIASKGSSRPSCSELENAVCAQPKFQHPKQSAGCSELENAVCAQRPMIPCLIVPVAASWKTPYVRNSKLEYAVGH